MRPVWGDKGGEVVGVRSWFVARPDPVTGDMRPFHEQVSWAAQGVIRRWSWVLANVAFSIGFWLWFGLLRDPAVAWNVSYSLMAIVVESIVGIGMFTQTQRDAVILRHVRDVMDTNAKQDEVLVRMETEKGQQLDEILVLLRSFANGELDEAGA